VPGFIDTHEHRMFDSGRDLLLNPAGLMARWYAEQERYVDGEAIVRRGMLRLTAGVTTMRILGDGLYSLRYPDVAAWRRVGPRILRRARTSTAPTDT
jgi:cytosine/adenosine deaminase-related metal-dependent hydrolase